MGAVTHERGLTLLNGEAAAAEPYRRLLISRSDPTKFLYADANDFGDAQFVSVPEVGDRPAASTGKINGMPISIGASYKVEANAAVTAGQYLYAADDGKVSPTAYGPPVARAITGTGAAGGIVEAVALLIAPSMIELRQTITASGDTTLNKPNWPCFLSSRSMFVSRDTSAANVKLKNGSNDITDAVAKGTSDNVPKVWGSFVDTYQALAATDTLKGNLSGAAEVQTVCVFDPNP